MQRLEPTPSGRSKAQPFPPCNSCCFEPPLGSTPRRLLTHCANPCRPKPRRAGCSKYTATWRAPLVSRPSDRERGPHAHIDAMVPELVWRPGVGCTQERRGAVASLSRACPFSTHAYGRTTTGVVSAEAFGDGVPRVPVPSHARGRVSLPRLPAPDSRPHGAHWHDFDVGIVSARQAANIADGSDPSSAPSGRAEIKGSVRVCSSQCTWQASKPRTSEERVRQKRVRHFDLAQAAILG